MRREVPGRGFSDYSRVTRKLSVAFPNEHLDALARAALVRGESTGAIVREAVALWVGQHGEGRDDA